MARIHPQVMPAAMQRPLEAVPPGSRRSTIQVNVEIMRTFVRLRRMLLANRDLARKVAALEKKYDARFRVVFEAIRELMEPPETPKRRIGFGAES
jgi:hypothetical protein